MKPKVFRLISVRNLSGRLVISRPIRKIRPDVGLAMQPIKLSRVVFPDPLAPQRRHPVGSIERVIPSTAMNSFDRPALKTFRTSSS